MRGISQACCLRARQLPPTTDVAMRAERGMTPQSPARDARADGATSLPTHRATIAHEEATPAMYEDKTLRCRECGKDFVFSAGEQEFYQLKGLMNEPGRCPECRAARRLAMASARATGERPPREMFKTVCAECGGEAQVPFIPKTEKPVYCSSCFEKVRAGASGAHAM